LIPPGKEEIYHPPKKKGGVTEGMAEYSVFCPLKGGGKRTLIKNQRAALHSKKKVSSLKNISLLLRGRFRRETPQRKGKEKGELVLGPNLILFEKRNSWDEACHLQLGGKV